MSNGCGAMDGSTDDEVFVTSCTHNEEEKMYLYLALSLSGLAIYAAKSYNVI